MSKEDVVHICNIIKKECNNIICRSMDGPRISGTKLSKLKRERETPHDITYMWNLKYDANELYL